jgi:hypothetical protein
MTDDFFDEREAIETWARGIAAELAGSPAAGDDAR